MQIAINIIKKKFDKRRYKTVDSINKTKYKCIMIEINDGHSPSIVLYYNDKNDDNVKETLKTCHFGNQSSVSLENNITRIDLFYIVLVKMNQIHPLLDI